MKKVFELLRQRLHKEDLSYMQQADVMFCIDNVIDNLLLVKIIFFRKENIIILCGHYKGIDQRVRDHLITREISIGDFVLTGGELPALTVADAVCRMLPGVLSDDICFEEESHFAGLLEYPQYTRPAVWNRKEVPEVLLSGNHAKIAEWRKEMSIKITKERRPDLLEE